ncbi:MAG: AAA family ATPase [Gammaproteobacteria bacterium]|nr:AAA family ATPase [Gammaproteobacteria bacterium]MDH5799424.1 AAA family ATPase [Gammaproteobacteria bacterium]
MNDEHDLKALLQSHFPIITIETHEEKRAKNLLGKVVGSIRLTLYCWSVTEGLNLFGADTKQTNYIDENGIHYAPKEPEPMLKHVKQSLTNCVVVLLDFHPYLSEPTLVRLIKEIALDATLSKNTLVLLSHSIETPDEIQRLCAGFTLSLPDEKKIRQLISDEAKIWAYKTKAKTLKADPKAISMLTQNLMGLTTSDARRLIRNAIYHDGAITQSDLPIVMQAKYELLSQGGILSFEHDTTEFAEVGGFNNLIQWIKNRKHAFLNRGESRLDVPKGIMLLGVQGGGKSLAAKAVAGTWNVPLLRMDFGALYNKYFGETEKNIRESLKTAEHMAPCVLWMDEIEKGIASGDYDSGTSRRVLGTLLTWMAENDKAVFIVATANDISSLPPELVRKGRLDEIFFVDLPQGEIRQDIFAIHLRKRNQDPARYDLAMLAANAQGFSGAEIEQAIVAATYAAHTRRSPMQTQDIIHELKNTHPLSVVMSEKIQDLRRWAKSRTVPA